MGPYRFPLVLLVLLTSVVGAQAGHENRPGPIRLAADVRPMLPIVVADKASPQCRAVADELAQYLDRITGGKFAIQTGDGSQGIVPGRRPISPAGNWPRVSLSTGPSTAGRRMPSVPRGSDCC